LAFDGRRTEKTTLKGYRIQSTEPGAALAGRGSSLRTAAAISLAASRLRCLILNRKGSSTPTGSIALFAPSLPTKDVLARFSPRLPHVLLSSGNHAVPDRGHLRPKPQPDTLTPVGSDADGALH
jgi:hypothetical protein